MRRGKRRKSPLKKICISLIVILMLWIIGYYLYTIYQSIEIEGKYSTSQLQSTVNAQNVENLNEKTEDITSILEETMTSVVGISKLKNAGESIFNNNSESELGLGTGIIVSENGYILSNEHVTGTKYSICYVTIENGDTYEATVVWSDGNLDLAILKIEGKNLPVAKLGDSDQIGIGQNVYAIGNPIGYEFRRTVTSGIISAKNRTIKIEDIFMTDLIQTDATINPGNSGGPLILEDGSVIGINTVKITSAEGIGFAVPINIVKPIIESFQKNQDFEEATIGIYAYDREIIPYIDNSFNSSLESGIYVAQITENGPVDNTDLKVGDIINSIDNIKLETINQLREYIYTKKPEEVVTLNISRGKIKLEIDITLGAKY